MTSKNLTHELPIGSCKKKNETQIQNIISQLLIKLVLFCKHHCIYLPFLYCFSTFHIKLIYFVGTVAFQIDVVKFLLEISKK